MTTGPQRSDLRDSGGKPTRLSGPPIDSGTVTGAEILAFDWSRTTLGRLESWPMSLRATLAAMLACPQAMFLAWGPDLLCFYNDAYRPILGLRLEKALGRPFREVWGSIWSDIEPLVEATLAGRPQQTADMKLDLSRQGAPEESWWSFTYSPVFDDRGEIAGLLCVTGETTGQVVAERERRAADERLKMALSAGNSIGTWSWDVTTSLVTADARFAALHGLDPDRAARGATLAEFVRGIHPDDRPRVETAIGDAVRTGGAFAEEYRLPGPDGNVRWVFAQGRCELAPDGRPLRFPGISFDITDRKATENALRVSEERFRGIVNSIDQMIWSTRSDGYHDYYNQRWYDYTGVPHGSMDGKGWNGMFHPDDQENALSAWRHSLATGEPYRIEYRLRDRSGRYRWVLGRAQPVRDETGQITRWFGSCTEIQEIVDAREVLARSREELERAVASRTIELMSAEEKLRQSQKMEAVGQLTGGIAHDFNNMLAIIIGGLNFAQRRLARGDRNIDRYIESAMEGATRAAALTQRLLAFSRQQPLAPEPVDCNAMLAGLDDLLTRTLGENVKLDTVMGADLWRAKADANQLENVVVNLAVNARDAMPAGGRLTIETANADLDDDHAREVEIAPGEYVMLTVTDTGTGMTPEVMARAFDPFFTTKSVGKGTGLGLSQVFGFVRQSGGQVKAQSEVGRGTTFRIYLPRFAGDAAAALPRRAPGPVRAGLPSEIVLVVEDESRVRNFSAEALRELGYTVLHAEGGPEALRMIEAGQDVTLLFTDVVMPEMTGRELAERAVKLLPRLKVLYTTGYTRDAVIQDGVLEPGTNLLPKPFGIDGLAAKVRAMLDGE